MSNKKKVSGQTILKALNHARLCAFYAEYAIGENNLRMKAKVIMKRMAAKAESIVKDLCDAFMDDEAKKQLMAALENPLEFDVITDIYTGIDQPKREMLIEYGAVLFDIQEAEDFRQINGEQKEFDGRIAPLRKSLEAMIKEQESKLSLMKKQLEFMDELQITN